MSDDGKIQVFAVERQDYSPEMVPIGFAENQSQAARMIRKHLAETTGDGDTGITARSIVYSASEKAYFIDN